MNNLSEVKVILGGMGVYISTPLANAVSRLGGLGTVSGVATERVLAFKLQKGDEGGHLRRALSHFPFQDKAKMVLEAFFIENGNQSIGKARTIPVFTVDPKELLISLRICADFAFIWLAKEGHKGLVSINYLEKIAMPHIYGVLGAILAGVDCITVGAGIPFQFPTLINSVLSGGILEYKVPIEGEKEPHVMRFDPKAFFGIDLPQLKRPGFIPIISSDGLASFLAKRLPAGSISGFVIEESIAGGHNAPPRGQLVLNAQREPVYGIRDQVDYAKIAQLGLPFWIGGGKASKASLKWARSVGASGIQVGTAFALCEGSGMDPRWRKIARSLAYRGESRVMTSMTASPTGYPFKVAVIPGTLSDPTVFAECERRCEHGALVTLFRKTDGGIGYRCPAEPIDRYISKGGKSADTMGRRCLCCGLLATAGLSDSNYPPIITSGDDRDFLRELIPHPDDSYNVENVFRYLGV